MKFQVKIEDFLLAAEGKMYYNIKNFVICFAKGPDEKRHYMKYFYPAVFIFNKKTNLFHIVLPDLAGCGGKAATVEEAVRKARESLGTSLWELEEKEIEFPLPSDENELRKEYRYGKVCTILIDMEEYRAYRAYKIRMAERKTRAWALRARKRRSIFQRVFGLR